MGTQKTTVLDQEHIEALYDAIMREIEPELLTDMIPYLDELYAYETPEEKQLRAERYERAYELFEQRFQTFAESWMKELQTLKKTMTRSKEQKEGQKEQDALLSMEHSFEDQS